MSGCKIRTKLGWPRRSGIGAWSGSSNIFTWRKRKKRKKNRRSIVCKRGQPILRFTCKASKDTQQNKQPKNKERHTVTTFNKHEITGQQRTTDQGGKRTREDAEKKYRTKVKKKIREGGSKKTSQIQ